jgi:SAM-dependent methyltransferase
MTYTKNPELQQELVNEIPVKFHHFGDIFFPPQRQIYEHAAKYPGTKADIGCGLGVGSYLLKCDGYDLSDAHIKFAKSIYSDRSYVLFDISKEQLLEPVDTVVCLEVIEHIEDVEAAVANLKASAKERVILSTPNRLSSEIGQTTPHNDYHVKEYTPTEMLEFFPGAEIRHPVTWKLLWEGSSITPLVYVWER